MITAPISIPAFAEPKKEQSEAQKAAHERQKKCGAEWQEMKKDGKVTRDMSWKKFRPDCEKRLKGT